jgi:ubiquinone/menaquinone biosynthesis C-methylase UbiE
MDWHTRYSQQARWTASLREYLFQKAGLTTARCILDVGCGTGVLLDEMSGRTTAAAHGLDLSFSTVKQASVHALNSFPVNADGRFLPYPRGAFDLAFCHYLLLWVNDPLTLVAEMKRVTRPGGAVLALAEPDYGGRIDFPVELAELGRWQAESLRKQGADPNMGRQLAGIFARVGLKSVETGVLGGMWAAPFPPDEREMEWEVLKSDLTGKILLQDIQKMEKIDEQAWQAQVRVLYVPTFYAWGTV